MSRRLHGSKLSALAHKIEVDHEEGLTSAQLLVSVICHVHLVLLLVLTSASLV